MAIITNIEDLRVLHKKRTPKMFYDYADSGSWTESTYRANESDFQKIKFRQRVAVDMNNRNQNHYGWPRSFHASSFGAYRPHRDAIR